MEWYEKLKSGEKQSLTKFAVWHGSQEMYQTFDRLVGRFVSELGMEAFPALETIKSFVTDERDLYAQSQVLDFHNKADGHERRLALYIAENFRPPADLKVRLRHLVHG